MLTTYTSLFLSSFLTLFIVIDPLMATPIFATLTRNDTPARQRAIALQAAVIAAAILTVFGLIGAQILHHLGTSLAAFRASGGLLLFLLGFQMFFEPNKERDAKTPGPKASARENVAFFPVGMPLLAGPGAIATVMLLMQSDAPEGATATGVKAVVLGAVGITLLIGVGIMSFAGPIANALGRTGQDMVSRILGMLLMAMSTQYIFDGVREGLFEEISPMSAALRALSPA
ncbi:MAG: MarC family protein [Pseudomonadota bacterium]